MEKLSICGERPVQQLCAAASSFLRLCLLALSLLGILHAATARGDPDFAIRTSDVVTGGLVLGNSITINVTAPSPGLIKQAKVTLNGNDVTSALLPDGNKGSITGVVSGLTVGPNKFEVFTRSGPKGAVAQLVEGRGVVVIGRLEAGGQREVHHPPLL